MNRYEPDKGAPEKVGVAGSVAEGVWIVFRLARYVLGAAVGEAGYRALLPNNARFPQRAGKIH